MSGKVLQQELFTKKLWFRALKKRGEQREELGEMERKQEEQASAGPTVEASTKLSANVLADRLCFPAPTAPAPGGSGNGGKKIPSQPDHIPFGSRPLTPIKQSHVWCFFTTRELEASRSKKYVRGCVNTFHYIENLILRTSFVQP